MMPTIEIWFCYGFGVVVGWVVRGMVIKHKEKGGV